MNNKKINFSKNNSEEIDKHNNENSSGFSAKVRPKSAIYNNAKMKIYKMTEISENPTEKILKTYY